MKVLLYIGLTIIGIIAVLLIVALFIPKKFTIQVTETIDRPKNVVYDYVRMLKNQQQYSVWVMEDPNLNPVITGTDGSVGAIQKWNSTNDNVGEGEQEITYLSEDRMDVDLRFIRPFKGNAKASKFFKSLGNGKTELVSEFYNDSKYPMNLMSFFVGKNMIKNAETENLKNIKTILEK